MKKKIKIRSREMVEVEVEFPYYLHNLSDHADWWTMVTEDGWYTVTIGACDWSREQQVQFESGNGGYGDPTDETRRSSRQEFEAALKRAGSKVNIFLKNTAAPPCIQPDADGPPSV